MEKMWSILKKVGLLAALPVLTGCNGGGGSASAFDGVGSLLAGSSDAGTSALVLADGGAGAAAAMVNPEPASLLLVTGGLAAMTYVKNRKRISK